MKQKSDIKINNLWYVCIIIRLLLSSLPLIYNYLINKNYKINIIKNISYINKFILIIFALGFFYKSICSSNNEIQISKVFWHETRIIHGVLIFLAGINFTNYTLSASILYTDLVFSIIYRFIKGHFNNTFN